MAVGSHKGQCCRVADAEPHVTDAHEWPGIGVSWCGDRRAGETSPRADRGLGALYEAFDRLSVVLEQVPYSDELVEEVREQLGTLDGVLVWVNPIQDGQDRGLLDQTLREVSAQGVWVSAHPDVALLMGTKQVLYRTRHLGWGSDTSLYESMDDFTHHFPDRLSRLGRLVVKQARGNGGNGVWKVELPGRRPGPADPGVLVRVQDASTKDAGRAGHDTRGVHGALRAVLRLEATSSRTQPLRIPDLLILAICDLAVSTRSTCR